MSIRTKISVRMNALTKEKVANDNIYISAYRLQCGLNEKAVA